MSTKTKVKAPKSEPSNGAPVVADPPEATRRAIRDLQYDAMHEKSLVRKRDLLLKVRQMRAATDYRDRDFDLEEAAEVHFLIDPIRDSLIKWADQEPAVTNWDLFQNEDGTCFLEVRVMVPNSDVDGKVRLTLATEMV